MLIKRLHYNSVVANAEVASVIKTLNHRDVLRVGKPISSFIIGFNLETDYLILFR